MNTRTRESLFNAAFTISVLILLAGMMAVAWSMARLIE